MSAFIPHRHRYSGGCGQAPLLKYQTRKEPAKSDFDWMLITMVIYVLVLAVCFAVHLVLE